MDGRSHMRARFTQYRLPPRRVLRAGLSWALLAFLPWGVGDFAGAALADVRNPDGVAIIIGNKDYEEVGDVTYAHRDAEAFRRYVVDVLGFDPRNVRLLKDATFGEMRSMLGTDGRPGTLDRYVEKRRELNDGAVVSDVVVYYSGHGLPSVNPAEPGSYLLSVEANLSDPALNAYSVSELYRVLGGVSARSVSVFLDACFTGTSGDGTPLIRASPVIVQHTPENVSKNTVVFTAAKAEQVAYWDDAAKHGMFTHHLLDALYGGGDADGDRRVTPKEVEKYLADNLWYAAHEVHGLGQDAVLLDGTNTGVEIHAWAPADGVFPARPDLDAPDPDPVADRAGNKDDGGSEEPAQIRLEEGYTLALADWALLATRRLEGGKHIELLTEADRYIRRHGEAAEVVDVRERVVTSLAQDIRADTKEQAQEALTRIEVIATAAGDRPTLLRLKAQAHRLLGDISSEAEAYERWLGTASQAHPERMEVLTAFRQLRLELSEINRFHELLGRAFSADARQENVGWTDLHYAALLNLPVVVAKLVDGGMAADVRLKESSPHFSGALKQALASLGHGEFEDWNADGETPLMIAVHTDAQGAAAMLLKRGADLQARDNNGNTPLHKAARENARQTAEWLISQGADVNVTADDGSTPLHEAARTNARAMAEMLVAHGANINAAANDGDTPLHRAAWGNARETAEWLVGQHSADIDAANINGDTPLHYAAHRNARETAEMLVASGANINVAADDGDTPLHEAVWSDARETAEMLVGRGVDINATDNDGDTPLHAAAWNNAPEMVEVLIARGAISRVRNNKSETPLHFAAYRNAWEAAAGLVKRGANINVRNDIRDTPLHEAAWNNARETAEWLAAQGADIHAVNRNSTTPLHYAALGDSRETAEWLVAEGADINAMDEDGSTPLDHTIAEGHAEMQNTLRDLGGRTAQEARAVRTKQERAKLLADRGTERLGRPFSTDSREESVGWTDLHFAALLDLPGVIAALIDDGAEVDSRLRTGSPPFGGGLRQKLTSLGHRETFEGWDVAATETPLMLAAVANARAAAEALIERGADITATNDYGETPLHYAAWGNARETAALLLDSGATVDATDNDGETPLHEAAGKSAVDMAAWLVARGADINMTNSNGKTPLARAIAAGDVEMRETLRQLGGRTAREMSDEHERAKLLAEQGTTRLGRPFSAHAREESAGWTDLHYAALLNLPGVVEALIESGLAVDVRLKMGSPPFGDVLRQALAALGHGEEFTGWTASGETPLMIAALANAREAAKALTANGADAEAKNDHGETPLHYAACGNTCETAALLLDSGATVDAADNDGETPLHEAAGKSAVDMAAWLVAQGADINAKDNDGRTPLHRAAWESSREVVELLVTLGADLNATANGGETPLHQAALANARETAEVLLAQGSDVNATNNHGETPLHRAARGNAGATAEMLIAHGAEINAKDLSGRTPLDHALADSEFEMQETLRRLGGLTAQQAHEEAERERRLRPFSDCKKCPEMVEVPAGHFKMGAPRSEADWRSNQGPTHEVTIPAPFAVSRFEVTVDEYRHFVEDTGRRTEGGCSVWAGSAWQRDQGKSWRSPGFTQTGRSPVVCVSWEDAKAYVSWLSWKTNESYRLLTEAEWEYSARAKSRTAFHTGDWITTDQANFDGNYTYNGSPKGVYRERAIEVGQFPANDFGLHDMHGNVSEWVEDCYHDTYAGAPTDGSAWTVGNCSQRVLRGGSWLVKPRVVRSASRSRKSTEFRGFVFGFRVARAVQRFSHEEISRADNERTASIILLGTLGFQIGSEHWAPCSHRSADSRDVLPTWVARLTAAPALLRCGASISRQRFMMSISTSPSSGPDQGSSALPNTVPAAATGSTARMPMPGALDGTSRSPGSIAPPSAETRA